MPPSRGRNPQFPSTGERQRAGVSVRRRTVLKDPIFDPTRRPPAPPNNDEQDGEVSNSSAAPVRARGNISKLSLRHEKILTEEANDRIKLARQDLPAIARRHLDSLSTEWQDPNLRPPEYSNMDTFEDHDFEMYPIDHDEGMPDDGRTTGLDPWYRDAEITVHGPVRAQRRWRDKRTRRERLKRKADNWSLHLKAQTDAYLAWKAKSTEVEGDCAPTTDSGLMSGPVVDAFGWHWNVNGLVIDQNPEENFNTSLLRRGLIGSSPLRPTWAVSLRTLETYRRLREVRPNLSIQGFAEALCATVGIIYSLSFRNKLDEAFHAYLSILREVRRRVQVALKRDSPSWRIKHSCPPCHHRVPGEPPLSYAQVVCIDGGNSLKRFRNQGHADQTSFSSDYILTEAQVDVYKDEVVKRTKTQATRRKKAQVPEEGSSGSDSDGSLADHQPAQEGPPEVDEEGREWITKNIQVPAGCEDGVDPTVCVRNWKANADDSEKKSLKCHDETGSFVCICEHGMIQITCSMVQSGELAKYGLALVDHLCENTPGRKVLGSDIGCAFRKTIAKTRVARSFGDSLCTVNVWHGFAHSRECQVENHPYYLDGLGLTSMEQTEQHFSRSNHVATLTRHATKANRLIYIDMHYQHEDYQHYMALGRCLYLAYRNALDTLEEHRDELAAMQKRYGYDGTTYRLSLEEEKVYIKTVGKEPEEDKLSCLYLEALDAWRAAEEEEDEIIESLKKQRKALAQPHPAEGEAGRGKRKKVLTPAAAQRRTLELMDRAEKYMLLLDLPSHWRPTDKEYMAARKVQQERQFRTALDRLEKFAVQRLFEIQKFHTGPLDYATRTSLTKHLVSRSESLKKAVAVYNKAAKTVEPPRPKLKAEDILNYSFCGEFDALRDSRLQILKKPWINVRFRNARDAYFRCERAKYYMTHLDVHKARLLDWLPIEEATWRSAISEHEATDAALEVELRTRFHYILNAHTVIRRDLRRLNTLPGYHPSFVLESPHVEDHTQDLTMRNASRLSDDDDLASSDEELGLEPEKVEERIDRLEEAFSHSAGAEIID